MKYKKGTSLIIGIILGTVIGVIMDNVISMIALGIMFGLIGESSAKTN